MDSIWDQIEKCIAGDFYSDGSTTRLDSMFSNRDVRFRSDFTSNICFALPIYAVELYGLAQMSRKNKSQTVNKSTTQFFGANDGEKTKLIINF